MLEKAVVGMVGAALRLGRALGDAQGNAGEGGVGVGGWAIATYVVWLEEGPRLGRAPGNAGGNAGGGSL